MALDTVYTVMTATLGYQACFSLTIYTSLGSPRHLRPDQTPPILVHGSSTPQVLGLQEVKIPGSRFPRPDILFRTKSWVWTSMTPQRLSVPRNRPPDSPDLLPAAPTLLAPTLRAPTGSQRGL